MNKSILLVAIAMMLSQFLHAQVKRQYKDEKFAEQTVVVKENAKVSDIDILNSQFDLDDVAVGEVIRITTETMPAKQPVAEAPAAPIVQEEAVAVVVPVQEIEDRPSQQERVRSPKTSSKSKAAKTKRKSKKKVKSKNPRFKKKKRKRVRNHKKKCYRF